LHHRRRYQWVGSLVLSFKEISISLVFSFVV
jgi:hypothetical protein